MSTITKKTENVQVIYKNGVIYVRGKDLNGVLEISSAELKNMYWKGLGNGRITVEIKTEE